MAHDTTPTYRGNGERAFPLGKPDHGVGSRFSRSCCRGCQRRSVSSAGVTSRSSACWSWYGSGSPCRRAGAVSASVNMACAPRSRLFRIPPSGYRRGSVSHRHSATVTGRRSSRGDPTKCSGSHAGELCPAVASSASTRSPVAASRRSASRAAESVTSRALPATPPRPPYRPSPVARSGSDESTAATRWRALPGCGAPGGAAGRQAREGIVARPADAVAGAEFKRLAAIEFDAAGKSGEGAWFPLRGASGGHRRLYPCRRQTTLSGPVEERKAFARKRLAAPLLGEHAEVEFVEFDEAVAERNQRASF